MKTKLNDLSTYFALSISQIKPKKTLPMASNLRYKLQQEITEPQKHLYQYYLKKLI